MKSKTLLWLLLIICSLALCLTGCGDDEGSEGQDPDEDATEEDGGENGEAAEDGGEAAGTQLSAESLTISAFYDPLIPDYIVYAIDPEGMVYTIANEQLNEIAPVEGKAPFSISACFLPETEQYDADYSIYVVDADGRLFYLAGDEAIEQAQIPGKGPFDVTTFYDPEIDDIVVMVNNAAGDLHVVWGDEVSEMGTLP